MRKSIFLLIIIFFLVHSNVISSHLAGGKFKLTFLGGNEFKLQLLLERDCSSGGAAFENILNVGLYSKSDNILVSIFGLKKDSVIKSPHNYDCNLIGRCYEQGYFSTNIFFQSNTLSHDSLGYYFYWERCCLADDIINIINPGSNPMGFLIDVPKIFTDENFTSYYINSSPFKDEIFNPLICLNQPFEYNFAYTDIDNDSLVYELVTPNAGAYTSLFNPGQNTGPKPYDDVIWSPDFTLINPIENSSGFAFNTNTGVMTFTPTQLGKFLFSIAVHEYRNGKKIGTVYYESILYVYDCTSAIILQPKEQISLDHSPVTFHVKHSDSTVTYQWQVKTPQDSTFSNIVNSTSDSLVIFQVVDSMNNYQYRCVMHKSTCDDISFAARLRIKGLGIENKISTKIPLFPNPSINQVSVKGIDHPQKISVYSLEGKLLKEIFNSSTFDVSDIMPGMYLVRVTDENNNSNYYAKLSVGK
jgi:hypothetical protein